MLEKMFAETSEKVLKNISSKTEIKTKSNKILLSQDLQIEQAQNIYPAGNFKVVILKH